MGFKCRILMALFYHSCQAKSQTVHQLIHTPMYAHTLSHTHLPHPRRLPTVHTGLSTSASRIFPSQYKSVVAGATWSQLLKYTVCVFLLLEINELSFSFFTTLGLALVQQLSKTYGVVFFASIHFLFFAAFPFTLSNDCFFSHF